jgi:chromosome partitioning protein
MNIRLAIFLGKGGVGKSTTAYALSSFLSANGHVLAIDLDPQATLTNALLTEKPQYGVYDALTGSVALGQTIVPAAAAYGPRLSVLAATSGLAALEQETASNFDRYYILRDLLDSTQGADFTIIDTPPSSTSLMTVAALVAATHVLTPISTDAAAFEQLPAFERLLDQVKRRLNPNLVWAGILPTRFDGRRRLDNEVLDALRAKYPLVHPPVAESVRIKEGMAKGLPANAGETTPFFDEAVASITKAVTND